MTNRHIAPERYSGSLSGFKVCATCNQTKATSLFPKDAQRKDGLRPNCKDCRSQQSKATYAKTREKVLRRLKEAYALDPSRVKETNRKWYAENKAEKLAKNRAWKIANSEAYLIQQRGYVERNREAANRRSREWMRANPEKARLIRQAHNAKRRAWTMSGISASDLATWYSDQDLVCFYCGSNCEDRPEVDHFYPLSRGGKHEIGNLRIACASCNRRKSARDPYEFMDSLVSQ